MMPISSQGEAPGMGSDPYRLMSSQDNPEKFDAIVIQTVDCFRRGEELLIETK